MINTYIIIITLILSLGSDVVSFAHLEVAVPLRLCPAGWGHLVDSHFQVPPDIFGLCHYTSQEHSQKCQWCLGYLHKVIVAATLTGSGMRM